MTTLDTLDIAKVTMAERQRQAEHGRLVALARRVAACCTRVSLRSRLLGFATGAGDTCCDSTPRESLSISNRANAGS